MPDAPGSPPQRDSGDASRKPPLGAALTALLGVVAATALFVQTPREESGRTVTATPQASGGITVTHVAGPQYLQAYLDIVKVPTACDGLTHGVKLGQRFTEAQCMEMLEAELVATGQRVLACTPGLKRQGRDYQRVGAVLFAYNIGWPSYCRSTAARLLNAGDVAGGCAAFLKFNGVVTAKPLPARQVKSQRRLADGRWFNVLRGLDDRRHREMAWCLKPAPASPPAPLPVVPVDYPLCVTAKPPPLLRSPDSKADYRVDPRAFNDKGTA